MYQNWHRVSRVSATLLAMAVSVAAVTLATASHPVRATSGDGLVREVDRLKKELDELKQEFYQLRDRLGPGEVSRYQTSGRPEVSGEWTSEALSLRVRDRDLVRVCVQFDAFCHKDPT